MDTLLTLDLKAEILERAPAVIAFLDTRQRILWANKAYQNSTGWTLEEMTGQYCYRIRGLDRPCSGCPVSQVLRTGEPSQAELTPENQEKWPADHGSWLAQAVPIRDAQGSMLGVVETAFEITEKRKSELYKWQANEHHYLNILEQAEDAMLMMDSSKKRAEDELRKSEERFRLAMQASRDGIWDWDIQTDSVYYSPAYAAMLGYSSGQVPQEASFWKALIHPEDKQAVLQTNQDCIQNRRQDFEIEFRMRAIDGQWRWILGRGKAVSRDQAGRALRLVGTHTDITDRKTAEEERKLNEARLESLLQLSEEQHADVNSFAAIALEESARLANSEIGFINFLSEDEVHVVQAVYTQKTLKQCRLPSDVDAFEISQCGLWSEAYRKRRPIMVNDYTLQHETKVGYPQGHPILYRFISIPIFDGDRVVAVAALGNKKTDYNQGDIRQFRLFMEGLWQIIQRKKAEEALLAAKKQAEEANRAKSQFLSNMSHEIRTPLNGVKGMLELASRKAEQPEVRQYLDLAKQSADHLMCIINDVIELSKIEAGLSHLHTRPFSLRDCLKATFYPLENAAVQKGLSFSLELDPDVPDSLVGDANRLRQVLENIVGNAIKFTHSGSVSVRISQTPVDTEPEGQVRLFCSVTDTGIGMSEQNQKIIFENFEQLDPAREGRYGGSGLGLAICKRSLDMMNGQIWCSSREGGGSTFSFTALFDRCFEKPSDQPSERQPQESRQRLRILVAEDNTMNQMFTQELLKDQGHRVSIAEDGREALEYLARQAFDLVLMDIRMPNLDGVEALRIIKQEPPQGINPEIPVIALTAYALKDDQARLLEQGFDGYLAKPIDIEAFESLLDNIGRRKGSCDGSS
jgi:PAS domain S-box-containing protein